MAKAMTCLDRNMSCNKGFHQKIDLWFHFQAYLSDKVVPGWLHFVFEPDQINDNGTKRDLRDLNELVNGDIRTDMKTMPLK